MPLWEGYDEWSHFGHIERLVSTGQLFANRNEGVSEEVLVSIQNAPVAWELKELPPPFLTHDEYWRLAPEERKLRAEAIEKIDRDSGSIPVSSELKIYEALQPPLYYWLLSVPYQLSKNAPLMERVFLLRYISLLIASLIVPLIFLVTLRVIRRQEIAWMATALFVALPEMMINVCRIGNECIGVLIFSAVILIALGFSENSFSRLHAVLLGALLGLGLLTKAYFLTAVPALGIIYCWKLWKENERRKWLQYACLTFGVAVLISGWWYVRNKIISGTWTGLNESLMLKDIPLSGLISGIIAVDWRNAFDSILVSHIWFGAWSSLTVRSWMYHLIFLLISIAVLGVILVWIRNSEYRRPMGILLAIYGFYWLGQLFNVLLLFLSKGASTSMGWYMYCVIAAQLTLLVIGVQGVFPRHRQPGMLLFLIFLIVALDLYTVHFVSIPYYTGLIAHRPNGFLENFHFSQLQETGVGEIFIRLSGNKPFWISSIWLKISGLIYFLSTAGLFIFAAKTFTIAKESKKN